MFIDTILYISIIIIYLMLEYIPVMYKNHKKTKHFKEIKCLYNEQIDKKDFDYFLDLKKIINNIDYFEDVDIITYIKEKKDLKNILSRLEQLQLKNYFLRFSMEWNIGIFMPFIFPIILNMLIIIKDMK